MDPFPSCHVYVQSLHETWKMTTTKWEKKRKEGVFSVTFRLLFFSTQNCFAAVKLTELVQRQVYLNNGQRGGSPRGREEVHNRNVKSEPLCKSHAKGSSEMADVAVS